jgi:hypothetical protein
MIALCDSFPQQPCQSRQGIHAGDALQLSYQHDSSSGSLPVNLDTAHWLEQHRLYIRLQLLQKRLAHRGAGWLMLQDGP